MRLLAKHSRKAQAAEEPVRVPSANVTVVDPREEGKLAEEIQKNLIRELEKEQAEQPKTGRTAARTGRAAERTGRTAAKQRQEQPEQSEEQPQEQVRTPDRKN